MYYILQYILYYYKALCKPLYTALIRVLSTKIQIGTAIPIIFKIRKESEIMKVDKTISNKFVRVDMTPQEYDAFVKILKLQRKDYKGGK